MKRWFIARMGDYENEGTLVPATNKYRPNGQLRADLLNDPTVASRTWSKSGFNWCLGQLAVADLTLIQADADIQILPDATLDSAWSSIPNGVRNGVINKLQSAGFATTGIQNSMTIRQVLVYVLKQIQPAMDSVEQGDVADVA